MKATEQYFPVVLLITLYKVILTFQYVPEILKCDYSVEFVDLMTTGVDDIPFSQAFLLCLIQDVGEELLGLVAVGIPKQ